jgi:hypothetical protein
VCTLLIAADSVLVRILQYRSVAFVTYHNELCAQFAKEAMACQSLDNDEILNVRWATQDPNPGQQELENQRLEELGKVAIQGKINPRIVDAVRHLRALEDGVSLEDEADNEDLEDSSIESDDNQPARKRQRVEVNDQADTGVLQHAVLANLKQLADVQQRRHGIPVKLVSSTPALKNTLGVADYGSDED